MPQRVEPEHPDAAAWGKISVIVPFGGAGADAACLAGSLARLELGPGDELIVADNVGDGIATHAGLIAELGARIVPAAEEPGSYFARNRAAETARGDWLLFLDADCEPVPDLLRRYRRGVPPTRLGVVAGSVGPLPDQRGLIPAYARDRGHLDSAWHLSKPDGAPWPAAIGGNMLVRREAFEELGGFHEGVRSAADVELCWRLQDCGWSLDTRPEARVAHRHVEDLGSMLAQARRHAAGRLWLGRRYPGCVLAPPLAGPLRSLAGVGLDLLRGRPRAARTRLLDVIWKLADLGGWYLGSNRTGNLEPARELQIWTDAYPARSETFISSQVEAMLEAAAGLEVISSARPVRTERRYARGHPVTYLEDFAPREKLVALGKLALSRPLALLRDRGRRRCLLREEPSWPSAALAPVLVRGSTSPRHLHAHFASIAAGNSLRAARIQRAAWSLSTHAYDVFQQPRNLESKLASAAFTTAECDYVAEELRRRSPPGAGPVEVVRTGTDSDHFHRRGPRPGRGRVVAIGRLVEKKGFDVLVAAAAHLEHREGGPSIEICGDGPLRAELESAISALPPHSVPVRLLGNVWGRDAVRDKLESADLLVIAARPAADGDRDALPLIAYEALSMEVPVVATDFVGLPEIVRPPWGALVEPGDPHALAAAIERMLSRSSAEVDAAARAGRQFIEEQCDSRAWAGQLRRLIERA